MKIKNVFKPMLTFFLVATLIGLAYNGIASIDSFMVKESSTIIVGLILSLLSVLLYLFLTNKHLKEIPKKTYMLSIGMVFIINLTLAIGGYWFTHNSGGVSAENGQVLSMIFIFLNDGFLSILQILDLNELLTFIIASIIPSTVLLFARKESNKLRQ